MKSQILATNIVFIVIVSVTGSKALLNQGWRAKEINRHSERSEESVKKMFRSACRQTGSLNMTQQKRCKKMLYRQKKDTHIRKLANGALITSKDNLDEKLVDESGAVFLCALSHKPQSLDVLADKILKVFVGVDKETIKHDAAEFYDSFVKIGFLVKGETERELNSDDNTGVFNPDSRVAPNRETINFYVPGLNQQYINFYRLFVDYMKKFPHRFMDNIKLPAFYGSFNNMIWNGGRIRLGKMFSREEIKETIKNLNDAGVAVRYTYTNSAIQEKHLYDTYCNATMELANNGKNEVLVNSPILENYLRKNYPNFKYILSTTTCERDVDKINEATEKYDLVVIDYRDNQNQEFLEKIKHKEKIEILIDEKCPSGCQNRKRDYELASMRNCFMEVPKEKDFVCPRRKAIKEVTEFYRGLQYNRDTNLSFNDVYGKYYDMGFRNFKFLGRNEQDLLSTFESYIYYMTAPDCRDMARYDLLNYYIDYLIDECHGDRKAALEWHEENLSKDSLKG